MNNQMINRWNSKVKENDIVYCLGDFVWGFEKNKYILKQITSKLKGRKFLIKGNHDHFKNIDYFEAGFEWVGDIYKQNFVLNNENYYFVLCHYAMKFWDRSHYGSYHLFGHEHFKREINFDLYKKLQLSTRCFNVCSDGNNYYPYSLEQIILQLKNNPINFNNE